MNWKCYSFLPLPLSTLRTANCHQVDAESSIHENLEWIPLDDEALPLFNNIQRIRQPSASSRVLTVHSSNCNWKSRQIKLHTHLWFVEMKSAARSGRNWFRIADGLGGHVYATFFTWNSLSIRTTHVVVISAGRLSIWHWIEIFHGSISKSIPVERVKRTLPPINEDELRRFGEKCFIETREGSKLKQSYQHNAFRLVSVYCDSSEHRKLFLLWLEQMTSNAIDNPDAARSWTF